MLPGAPAGAPAAAAAGDADDAAAAQLYREPRHGAGQPALCPLQWYGRALSHCAQLQPVQDGAHLTSHNASVI